MNDALLNVHDLIGVTTIGAGLSIGGNNALPNLIGLNGITSIGTYCSISNNPSITSLNGLNSLTSIGSNLDIVNNPLLTNLNGLNALTSMNGFVNLNQNIGLVSLKGIENINPNGITNLIIKNSNLLSHCEVASICAYLTNPSHTATILGNANHCSCRDSVVAACIPVFTETIQTNAAINIFPNPTTGNVRISGVEAMHPIELKLTDATGRILRVEKSIQIIMTYMH